MEQAARLDAREITDVKICQTLMNIRASRVMTSPPSSTSCTDGRIEVRRQRNAGCVCFQEPVPVIILLSRRYETAPFPLSLSSNRTRFLLDRSEHRFQFSTYPVAYRNAGQAPCAGGFYSASARMI